MDIGRIFVDNSVYIMYLTGIPSLISLPNAHDQILSNSGGKTMLRKSVLIILLGLIIPTMALAGGNMKKAKEFMQAGMYPQAIDLFSQEINDSPTKAEAHFLLGVCYIYTQNLPQADERFSSAVKLQPDYGYQIGEKYKEGAEKALAEKNFYNARSRYLKAIDYDPRLSVDAYDFFLQLAKKAKVSQSDDFFDDALQFARTQEQKKEIAKACLRLAVAEWPGRESDMLKEKAAQIIGWEITNDIIPQKTEGTEAVWSHTYTDADADKDGVIKVLSGQFNINPEDTLILTADVPKGADKIYFAENKKWVPVPKGGEVKVSFKGLSQQELQGKFKAVWIDKGKGVKVYAKVIRKTNKKLKPELIDGI